MVKNLSAISIVCAHAARVLAVAQGAESGRPQVGGRQNLHDGAVPQPVQHESATGRRSRHSRQPLPDGLVVPLAFHRHVQGSLFQDRCPLGSPGNPHRPRTGGALRADLSQVYQSRRSCRRTHLRQQRPVGKGQHKINQIIPVVFKNSRKFHCYNCHWQNIFVSSNEIL